MDRDATAQLPAFIRLRCCCETYGVSRRFLVGLADQGAVRSFKMGEAKQAGRLYSRADLEDALEALMSGRRPAQKTRRCRNQKKKEQRN